MGEPLGPAESGRHVSSNAERVRICGEGIEACAAALSQRIASGKLGLADLFVKTPVHPQRSDDAAVDWVFFADALNFSFWNPEGQPQYLVTYKDETYTGYLAFCAAINRSLDSGVELTSPQYFKDVTREKLDALLKGDNGVPCPMIEDRVMVLKEVAEVLISKFNGSFVNCVKASDKSAQKLLQIITDNFPPFRDVADFAGKKVSILKRAQILVADVWALFKGKGLGEFEDIESLTMFADYRVPQSLQYFGAMVYSEDLLKVLEGGDLLPNGDPLEVEIRGCSIEAVQRVVQAVRKLTDGPVNAVMADYFLWGFRRERAEEMTKFPYHKTRSIFY